MFNKHCFLTLTATFVETKYGLVSNHAATRFKNLSQVVYSWMKCGLLLPLHVVAVQASGAVDARVLCKEPANLASRLKLHTSAERLG